MTTVGFEQVLDLKKTTRRAVLAGGGLLAAGLLSGCAASMVHSGPTLTGRRLLTLSIERSYAQLASANGFWDSRYRLAIPRLSGTQPASASNDPALQRQLNDYAYKAILEAQPVLMDAAERLPMKYGRQAYRGQMSISAFMRRGFGASLDNVLFSNLYTIIGNGSSISLAMQQQLAHDAADALWRTIAANEAELKAHPGELDTEPMHTAV
ncbi:DUF4197 family protein [Novosphingobium sp. 9]|uniref:DUF4197 family protein n=1 Tax=Novosphingobium sp. 9 TaxID=2025349 RepID=UPI0021B6C96F|nr:DUF4197 family protein [Novosphingobium sp. 9]